MKDIFKIYNKHVNELYGKYPVNSNPNKKRKKRKKKK